MTVTLLPGPGWRPRRGGGRVIRDSFPPVVSIPGDPATLREVLLEPLRATEARARERKIPGAFITEVLSLVVSEPDGLYKADGGGVGSTYAYPATTTLWGVAWWNGWVQTWAERVEAPRHRRHPARTTWSLGVGDAEYYFRELWSDWVAQRDADIRSYWGHLALPSGALIEAVPVGAESTGVAVISTDGGVWVCSQALRAQVLGEARLWPIRHGSAMATVAARRYLRRRRLPVPAADMEGVLLLALLRGEGGNER